MVKLPRDDRRFGVLTCGAQDDGGGDGPRSGPGWRSRRTSARCIGRCWRRRRRRSTCSTRLAVPPPFAGRLEMIGMGETRLEDAYGAAIEALEGFPLFTMTQAQRLIGYFGDYKTGDWTDMARHTVAKNAYRLRERGEPNNRIKYRKREEIIYARTKADQQSWHPADTQMIIKQLDMTEAMIVRLVNTGQIDIAARLEELRREPRGRGGGLKCARSVRGWNGCAAEIDAVALLSRTAAHTVCGCARLLSVCCV